MDKKITLEQYRESAKIIMTLSLAVTVFTGPYARRSREMRLAHTAAGAILVASSIWHHSLYGVRAERTRAMPPPVPAEAAAETTADTTGAANATAGSARG